MPWLVDSPSSVRCARGSPARTPFRQPAGSSKAQWQPPHTVYARGRRPAGYRTPRRRTRSCRSAPRRQRCRRRARRRDRRDPGRRRSPGRHAHPHTQARPQPARARLSASEREQTRPLPPRPRAGEENGRCLPSGARTLPANRFWTFAAHTMEMVDGKSPARLTTAPTTAEDRARASTRFAAAGTGTSTQAQCRRASKGRRAPSAPSAAAATSGCDRRRRRRR